LPPQFGEYRVWTRMNADVPDKTGQKECYEDKINFT
jgi:hypothetical protein